MAKQTYTVGQTLTAAQMTQLQADVYSPTVSVKTSSYVLVAADAGTRIEMNVASANTVTVNTSLFTAGDTLIVSNKGAGQTTIVAGTATVSSAGVLTLDQYANGELYFVSAGVAIFSGSMGAGGDLTAVTAGTGISVASSTGPVPTVSIDTAVTADLTTAQTLTNKKLSDSTTTIVDVTDATKAIKFDVAGTTAITGTIATAFTTAKTLTLPDATDTLVGKATTDTLTNKTLTSPALTTPTISTATTNGDILYGTGSGALARLGIGSSAQVLTVASGIPSWATAASSGGMTLITTTTWNNTVGTYTYSSLGSYKHLMFVGQNLKHSQYAALSRWNIRLNGSTASVYGQSIMEMNGTTYSGTSTANQADQMILSMPAGSMLGASGGGVHFDGECEIVIPDYGSGQKKCVFWRGGSCQDGTRCASVGTGHFSDTTAITSVTLFLTSGNFESGTIRLYGVS